MNKIFILLFSFFCNKGYTQFLQSTSSTAAQATIGSITINYTIGEMVLVNTWAENGLLFTQGVNQPFVPASLLYDNTFNLGELRIYPIPTQRNLNIQLGIPTQGNMQLQLTDALGQMVLKNSFEVPGFLTKTLDLGKFAAGTYFLHLQFKSNNGQGNKKGSFKIIKQ